MLALSIRPASQILIFQANPVEYSNMPMAVADQARGLELQGGLGHAGAPHPEHVGNEFLRHRQLAGGQPVDAQQQPSAQLLVDGVMAVAYRGLRHLRNERLRVAEQQALQRSAPYELLLVRECYAVVKREFDRLLPDLSAP